MIRREAAGETIKSSSQLCFFKCRKKNQESLQVNKSYFFLLTLVLFIQQILKLFPPLPPSSTYKGKIEKVNEEMLGEE